MAKKGISRDVVLTKAVEMIERTGTPVLSMRELAEELKIKTPSLYNHVKGVNDLLADVSRYAAEELRKKLLMAIAGKNGDDALNALAGAYRNFAKEHIGLYKVTNSVSALPKTVSVEIGTLISEPIFLVLSQYGLDEEQSIHWQRVLRSIIHGFLSQEEAGFFQHCPLSVEASYQVAVHCYIEGLHTEARGYHNVG
ncbi:TetR/AcrR family transcriptional regulator [uncultured Dysosmobacter sp.]|uniref:TetR/AcrR family transcriptional regulator n=1 Tax=uncultured Dysosmobacter sp. TaxID=2591384 RepID=UPI002627D471|nr:TetR/AcrR family transcriptional regulator [uncultured Dysosmobacter sp.]